MEVRQLLRSTFLHKKKVVYLVARNFSDINLNKVFVQAKLTIIGDKDPNEAELLKSKISEFANTQNAVNSADLVSNHPLHLRIEMLSRNTMMPAGEMGVSTMVL